MSEFLAMGGYAAFVWPTWAVSALVIGALVVHALLERKAARDALRRIEEDEA
ncbi:MULTISPECIES: heme exporter protein CcmD [Maricaulis]|uniref:Heme exporter protein D n=1 Tax=Maricaulis maris TaxID=74318 RepID=A0A495D3Y6_9PROT|nr:MULTISPECIES: heme exporter protein CcmD [Maricaulis]RKQ96625.1 heme exporter protein CcmD [Maricaulis maris]